MSPVTNEPGKRKLTRPLPGIVGSSATDGTRPAGTTTNVFSALAASSRRLRRSPNRGGCDQDEQKKLLESQRRSCKGPAKNKSNLFRKIPGRFRVGRNRSRNYQDDDFAAKKCMSSKCAFGTPSSTSLLSTADNHASKHATLSPTASTTPEGDTKCGDSSARTHSIMTLEEQRSDGVAVGAEEDREGEVTIRRRTASYGTEESRTKPPCSLVEVIATEDNPEPETVDAKENADAISEAAEEKPVSAIDEASFEDDEENEDCSDLSSLNDDVDRLTFHMMSIDGTRQTTVAGEEGMSARSFPHPSPLLMRRGGKGGGRNSAFVVPEYVYISPTNCWPLEI